MGHQPPSLEQLCRFAEKHLLWERSEISAALLPFGQRVERDAISLDAFPSTKAEEGA
jgi:hypothetical protein